MPEKSWNLLTALVILLLFILIGHSQAEDFSISNSQYEDVREPPTFTDIMNRYDSELKGVFTSEQYAQILIEFLLGDVDYYIHSEEDLNTYELFRDTIERYTKTFGRQLLTTSDIIQELQNGRVSEFFTSQIPSYRSDNEL